jgi:glycosyltransferase involved in cell wall biosynthesis
MHVSDAHIRAHFQMAHQVEAYRSAEAVAARSRREAEPLADMGVAPARIHILPMGVDPTSATGIQAPDVVEFRHRHGVEGRVVAFLGANTHDKGAFALALAVAQLNTAGLGVHLICGGPERDRLAAFLRRQPAQVRSALQGRLHLLGIVSEKDKHLLLATCDLLALPSRVDGFGIVILEAWLHGKPVIGADAGGIADLVTPEETGLLVPFGDVSALASAIRRLITEPELVERLGTSGRQRAVHCYTWDRTYRRLLAVYSSALAEQEG